MDHGNNQKAVGERNMNEEPPTKKKLGTFLHVQVMSLVHTVPHLLQHLRLFFIDKACHVVDLLQSPGQSLSAVP